MFLPAAMPRRAQPARLRPLLLLLAAAVLVAPTGAARALRVVATATPVVAEGAAVAPTAAAGPVSSAIAGQGTLGPTQAPVVAEAPAAGMSAWVAAGSDAVPGGIQEFGVWTIGRLVQILVAVFLLVLVCFFMIVRHAARPRTGAALHPALPTCTAPRCCRARADAPARSSRQMASNWEQEQQSEEWRPFAKAGRNYASTRPPTERDDNPWREGRRVRSLADALVAMPRRRCRPRP